MENIVPLDHIPDKWLEKSRCPVCSSTPMNIAHHEWEPDQFICPNCGIHFQVAKNHPSIFVFQEPIDENTGYLGQWVEMKTLVQESRTRHEMEKKASISAIKAQQHDGFGEEQKESFDPIYDKYPASVIDSADSLYEMGNSLQSIKTTLSRSSQLSEDSINEILDYVSHKKRKKEGGSFKLPRWAIGCITVPVLMIITYFAFMFYFQYSFQKELAAAPGAIQFTVIDFEKLPALLRDEIPEDIRNMQTPKGTVTKFPTTTLPQAACPTTIQGAMTLFGGQYEDWEYRSDQKAWILETTYLRTINLPQDYVAVMPYLNHGLVMQFVSGPARIQNAYLVVITCP